MITKMKKTARSGAMPSIAQTPAWTTAERLLRIQAMGQRITSYVQYMCQVGDLKGSSTEATEKAVSAFYDQMVVLERQLALIHDEFKLE